MRSLPLFLASAVFLFASLASADAVPPPPSSCPDGSQGATCHGGPHCAPRKCNTDADCKTGEACEDHKLCNDEINCAGGWHPPDAGPTHTPNITGNCDTSGCAKAQCVSYKVCFPKTSGSSSSGGTSSSSSSGGGGICSYGPSHGDAPAPSSLAALAACLGLAALRRRRA